MFTVLMIACTYYGTVCSEHGAPTTLLVTESQCIAAQRVTQVQQSLRVWCFAANGDQLGAIKK